MIFGDVSLFAIESSIDAVFRRDSMMALGCFRLHVGGRAYGVAHPRATMLASSFDAALERVANRGGHVASFATAPSLDIVQTHLRLVCGVELPLSEQHTIDPRSFLSEVKESGLVMAPDGDAAFDDGSHVLQFDLGRRVRLVAFRGERQVDAVVDSISDVEMDGKRFYPVLEQWTRWLQTERGMHTPRSLATRLA